MHGQGGTQEFDISGGTTLLGQPSNSRFSQLLSPGSSGGYRGPSGAGRTSQSVLNSQRILAQRGAQRSAKLAAAPKRSGTFTLGGLGGLGSLSGTAAGQTAVTPRGPSAGVISGLQSLVGNYNKSFDTANKANESRYQQLLGLADQDVGQEGTAKTYEDMLALAGRRGATEMGRTQGSFAQRINLADQTSNQRATDIRSDFFNRGADQQQKLARLGMANTTVGTSLSAGNQREMQASLNRSADLSRQVKSDLIGGRASELNQLSEQDQTRRLGIMERGQGALSNLQQRAQQTKMGIMERRTDAGPSSQSLMDIIAGVGSQFGGGTGLEAMLRAFGSMRS